jgi:DNA polymerase phi
LLTSPLQEERDYHFGRLFGLEAIIKSGTLFHPEAPIEHWKQVLDLILELAKKKAWLSEECAWIVTTALQTPTLREDGDALALVTTQQLKASGIAKTAEGVAIWLVALHTGPDAELPQSPWKHGDPLHPDNAGILGQALREGFSKEQKGEDANKNPQKGSWTPQLHFVWDLILKFLYVDDVDISSKRERITFDQFWTAAIDSESISLHYSLSKTLTYHRPTLRCIIFS